MAMPGAFHHSTALFVVAALVLPAYHVQGWHSGNGCPPFSCGHLGNVSSPFRRRDDPPWCGDESYELSCSDTEATIRIDGGAYHVTRISKSDSTLRVVDAGLGNSSCPLPRWNRNSIPYAVWSQGLLSSWNWLIRKGKADWHWTDTLKIHAHIWAAFVRCSQLVKSNGMYMPVDCLNNKSFVYVLTGTLDETNRIANLEPSCGYLAMTPLGATRANLSYQDVVKFMRSGFSVRYENMAIDKCIKKSCIAFYKRITNSTSIKHWIGSSLGLGGDLFGCLNGQLASLLSYPLASNLFPYIEEYVLGRFVLGPPVVLIFIAYHYWKTRITMDAVDKFLRMQQMLSPTRYAYTDITAITSHFKDKLGQGGYGAVYRGVLPGDVHVAVKMLGNSNTNGEEFISEVATIGRIHHINVVRLVGFCSEVMRRALVYEYMPRGSLDKYIFSSTRGFSWDKLNEIALGIAKGINYLHEGCDMQILHFDIKPHNILLDDNFIPKVADFGLSKLCPKDKSFLPLSALRGTVGYIAPEMISRGFGIISSKSDVYSFGMLLLEMAGGRRNADENVTNSSQAYYPSWVYDRLREQQEAVDEISAANADNMHDSERKLCIVGLWCIQMKSHDRPTMSEVIEMLECGVDSLEMPSRPFFCDEGCTAEGSSYHFSSELSTILEEGESIIVCSS